MRILVTGWFSYKQMGNTAGDMIARDLVCSWLKEAHISFDVAVSDPGLYFGGLLLEDVDPPAYSDLVFVCGPFGNGWPITELLQRFSHCRLIGVNLTMLEPLEKWNPFSLLLERDSSVRAAPDITFLGPAPTVPVVGIILITKQDEYGERDLHEKANRVIEEFRGSREMSVVMIDTVLENNKGGLRTPGEIESLISRMDIVITTRLHGTVLALKNGVPVIPIDPVAGGAKVSAQAKTLGWPVLFKSEEINAAGLNKAFDYCLTEQARLEAKACAVAATLKIAQARKELLKYLLQEMDLTL